MPTVETTTSMVQNCYSQMNQRISEVRKLLNRPLTLTEKILFSHLENIEDAKSCVRGKSFLLLRPDRVAMQDATAQMAILQFIQSGKKQVAVPSTVHCDHLIRAHSGADSDMKIASTENREVFDFLKSASQKYGIGFWGPGAGIIHQVVLENYAFPGGLMIGTDSHTPNAGGLGMFASGVGGADAVDVMAGMPWELLAPEVVGIKLTGKLNGWTSPKDVILKVLDIMTVKGGTNRVMEYFGPGVESISCTGKGTITNMGAELGATTSIFPFDAKMAAYLEVTDRANQAKLAQEFASNLTADPEVLADPIKYYDKVIEIDLDKLEPHIVGPHSPDLARPVSKLGEEVNEKGYPERISAALVGSCTNSSYEDIDRAAGVARYCLDNGIKAQTQFLVSPGSDKIFNTIKRDGLMGTLEEFGATVLANACGPCIGQWQRDDINKGDKNSIVTSFNRNFRGRNDANPETLGFIASPEIVIAYAASGSLKFNPLSDTLKSSSGKEIKLKVPTGKELPPKGFEPGDSGYIAPAADGQDVNVQVSPDSERLQLLAPFEPLPEDAYKDLPLLIKTKGKATTDHISPAGKWLRYRGHLDRISDNMFLGASNAFGEEIGQTLNIETGTRDEVAKIAREYKKKKQNWIVVGDENYGEGSSREHAAMSPRFLGCAAVIVKSFARIHETNLKKQGVMALTFADPNDYNKIQESDHISIEDPKSIAPSQQVRLNVKHADGSSDIILANHSYNADQVKWFKAGSALNLMKD